MPTAGQDVFFADPGTVTDWHCRVCGAAGRVERNVFGPTSSAEAMARRGHPHDRFECPHLEAAWHGQAAELLREREATRSQTLRAQLEAELDELLRQAGCAGPRA